MSKDHSETSDRDKERRQAASDYTAQVQRLRLRIRVQCRGASILVDGKPHSLAMVQGMTETLSKQPDPIR